MKTYVEINDTNSNFDLVLLSDSGNTGNLTPHCKNHGAMNKVSIHEDGGGYWRCLQSSKTECRAGCNEKRSIIDLNYDLM